MKVGESLEVGQRENAPVVAAVTAGAVGSGRRDLVRHARLRMGRGQLLRVRGPQRQNLVRILVKRVRSPQTFCQRPVSAKPLSWGGGDPKISAFRGPGLKYPNFGQNHKGPSL